MIKRLLLCLLSTAALLCSAAVKPVILKNNKVEFQFTANSGALIKIRNLETKRDIKFLTPVDLWRVDLVEGTRNIAEITGGKNPQITIRRNGKIQTLSAVWNVHKADNTVKVTMTVKLADNQSIADWHLDTEVTGKPALWVKEVAFPRMVQIQSLGDDAFFFGKHLGRLIRKPGSNIMLLRAMFPGEWSMQLAAFCGSNKAVSYNAGEDVSGYMRGPAADETGLYVAMDDPGHYVKEITTNRNAKNTFEFQFHHYPSFPFWPADSQKRSNSFKYSMPYTVKMGAFTGSIGKAAEIYRDMVKDRKELAGGKLFSANNPTSKKVLDSVFWGKIYWGANKVVPEMLRMQEYLQVPINVHWVRFSVNPFDDNNTNYTPVAAQFREGVQALRDAGIGVAPYVCCGVWDKDTETYKRYNIGKAAALDQFGKPIVWILHGQESHWMNPASPEWRKGYQTVTSKLFGQWDTDGQYLDVMSGGSHLSFNSGLHKVNGGNYWAQGNFKLLDSLNSTNKTLQEKPFLITECFAESYIGRMDSFLMLDMTRYGWINFRRKEVFPISSLIYHDYTTFYGSDCDEEIPLDMNRWNMGLSFVWGIQLCYSAYKISPPGVLPHDRLTKDLAQAWHQVGRKFLAGGRGIETALVTDFSQAGKAAVAVKAAPYKIGLKDVKGDKFFWQGPAVPGSTWEAIDGTIGLTFANVSDKDQKLSVQIDPAILKSKYNTIWQTWPLPARKIGKLDSKKVLDFTVPCDRGLILEIRSDAAPEVTPLVPNKIISITADDKGVFAAREVKDGKLYGTDRYYALHADGKVSMTDAAGKALKAIPFNWRRIEGYSGPRDDNYRTFYVLKDSGCTLSDYKTASIRINGGVMSGSVELTKAAELTGAKDMVLLASNGSDLIVGKGKIKLAAGNYRIAAYSTADAALIPVGKDLAKLAAISAKAADLAAKTLTGKDVFNSAKREEGVKFAAIGNAVAYVVTGKTTELINNQQWLMPGKVFALKYSTDNKGKLTLLNSDHVKTTKISSKDGKSFDVMPGSIESASNIFRFIFRTATGFAGKQFAVTSVDFIEVAEPLIAEIPAKLEEYVKMSAEDVIKSEVTIRNVSPEELTVTITPEIPAHWELSPKENNLKVTIKGNSSKDVKLLFRRKGKGNDAQKFVIRINYCDAPYASITEEFTVVNRVVKVEAAGKGNSQLRWSDLIRYGTLVAVPGAAGKTIRLGFISHDASSWNQTRAIKCTILDRDMKVVKTETVKFSKVHETRFIDLQMPAGDAAFIRIEGKFFKLAVSGVPHHGLSCWNNDPLNIFTGKQTFYIHVKKGATKFAIIGEDGGPQEIARIVVRNPEGKVVFNRQGNYYAGSPVEIPVKPGQDDKTWCLEISPREDFALRLGEGVSEWVSLHADSVIKSK